MDKKFDLHPFKPIIDVGFWSMLAQVFSAKTYFY